MVDNLYDGELREHWLDGLANSSAYNVRHILSAFAMFGLPESYLDVGCGDGTMVRTAAMLGVRAYGVDQLVEPDWGTNFFHQNLVDYFKLPDDPVEIVTCLEVAEHLHESAHAALCETICNNLKPGGILIFSAARPGQGGTKHIACRPAEYWHNEMILRGLSYNAYKTMNLALIWSNIGSPLNYLWDNLIVFNK